MPEIELAKDMLERWRGFVSVSRSCRAGDIPVLF